MTKKRRSSAAYRIALVGVCAASIECGKLVLSGIPNVEVVTLLCALYGYVFGPLGVLSAVVFVSLEPIWYGFGTWVISYYLYWPFVSLVFYLLGRAKVKNRFALTAVALLLTAWFGVLTSLVDTGLFTGFWNRFFWRFSVLYMRGVQFYITQFLCNAVLFPLCFCYLAKKLADFSHKALS